MSEPGRPRPQRVLIVEDDSALSRVLTLELNHAGFAVDAVASGEDAFDRMHAATYDCVLLDVMLPGISGLEVLRRLRATEGPEAPAVILVTARGQIPDKVAALDAGADDYLVKPVNFEELAARIRAVIRRRAPGGSRGRVLEAGDVVLYRDEHRVVANGRPVPLTPLEFQLLEHLMLHPNLVQSRHALLARVWGYDAEVQTAVVDVTMSRLRRRLEASGSRLEIETVRGVGYAVRVP
ncbi:MAG: response regulator transcription factor [Firmicutes bacterium]|nr:response regulator transcription factor [Bacillota bacterium]